MSNLPLRRSLRHASRNFHPYVLCIIDMQPVGFSNSNIVLDPVMRLVNRAMVDQAFIVIAQYKGCGATHGLILDRVKHYAHKAYVWHHKNDKSKVIQEILKARQIFVRQIKVCGVNTEYCVKDTVHGLAKKFSMPIKVIENACNGTDRTVDEAIQKMKTFYRNVVVV